MTVTTRLLEGTAPARLRTVSVALIAPIAPAQGTAMPFSSCTGLVAPHSFLDDATGLSPRGAPV